MVRAMLTSQRAHRGYMDKVSIPYPTGSMNMAVSKTPAEHLIALLQSSFLRTHAVRANIQPSEHPPEAFAPIDTQKQEAQRCYQQH